MLMSGCEWTVTVMPRTDRAPLVRLRVRTERGERVRDIEPEALMPMLRRLCEEAGLVEVVKQMETNDDEVVTQARAAEVADLHRTLDGAQERLKLLRLECEALGIAVKPRRKRFSAKAKENIRRGRLAYFARIRALDQ